MNFVRKFVGYQGRKNYVEEGKGGNVIINGGNVNYTVISGGGGGDTGTTTGGTGTTIDAYTKEEADARFQPVGDYALSSDVYTKSQAQLKFQPLGDYALVDTSYTKAESDAKYQPTGNYLTEHQKLKTINGESLVGTGDIVINGNLTIEPLTNDLFDNQYIGAHADIGQKEVARVNDGVNTFYLTSIDREAYKICLYKQTAHLHADKYPITGLPQNLIIKFENYDTRLSGNTKYRLCLMEWRKDKDKCWHWSIPMVTPRWDTVTGAITHESTKSRYAFNETFNLVAGQETKMFGGITGKTWADILPLEVVNYEYVSERRYRFKNGRSNRIFGFALFRLFEPNSEGYVGRYEWARVSNIAKFQVTVDQKGDLKARVLP